MWERVTEHGSAKKYRRGKSWKSQSPYSSEFAWVRAYNL